MPNIFDFISGMSRQSRIALATWLCRSLRLSSKEWQQIMGVSAATYYKRRNG